MPQIEDIQEEVLTELCGTTNIASSLWGLFGGEGTGYINRTKKNVASTLKKAETFVEKRRAVYAGKSYASIRETVDETMQRLLKEMDLEEWKVTPRLRDDPEYAYQMALRAGRIAGKAYDRGSVDKRLATGNAEGFVGAVHDAHQKRIADTKTADKILGGAAPGAFDADIIRNDIQTNFDQELDQAAVSSSWMSNFDNMRRRADGN